MGNQHNNIARWRNRSYHRFSILENENKILNEMNHKYSVNVFAVDKLKNKNIIKNTFEKMRR